VYHHFLQRALIDTISFRHFGAWRVQRLRFDMGATQEHWGGAPDAEAYGKLSLTAADLKALMAGNRFGAIDPFGPGTLALPPATRLHVEPPTGEPSRGVIHFSNWFSDLTIETTYSMAAVGLGQYPLITGLTIGEAQDRFVWTQYIVRAEATFRPWLFGHPHMSAYRDWASGIIDDIAAAFDEQRLWRGAVDSFMLRQHVADQPRLAVAPIQVTPKAPNKDAEKQ
jgi:hypothetical protein